MRSSSAPCGSAPLRVDEKRQKYLEAKARFAHAEAAHPAMKPKEVKPMPIKERLAAMTPHGRWEDQWLDHPFPAMGEPEKAVAYLTDFGDYDEDHRAWLYNKASLHGVDSFLNQVRRRLSLLERPIQNEQRPDPVRLLSLRSRQCHKSPRYHAHGPQLHPDRQGW